MKSLLPTLNDVMDIKDARITRPSTNSDTVVITGEMIDSSGSPVPVRVEAYLPNGKGLHFVQKILGRTGFDSVDTVIKLRKDK